MIPSSRKIAAISSTTSSSAIIKRRAAFWMVVTSLPNRRNICPNSKPRYRSPSKAATTQWALGRHPAAAVDFDFRERMCRCLLDPSKHGAAPSPNAIVSPPASA